MSKNKCQVCGGRLVAEYIGNYGDIYIIGKNGETHKRKYKRIIYESNGDEPMIYCLDCGQCVDEDGERR